jgi:outer membrane biosynthesis protein TonB
MSAAAVAAAELPSATTASASANGTVEFVSRGPDEIGPLPYDARYAQLTPAEREVVRSAYQAMPEGDEPPYPADGIGALLRPLLKAAHTMYIEGPVDALVEIGPDGAARSVEVYSSPEPMFTKVVVSVLMGASYKPAVCKGVPCTMQFPLRVKLPRS